MYVQSVEFRYALHGQAFREGLVVLYTMAAALAVDTVGHELLLCIHWSLLSQC